jgi:hypothetical protein
MIDSIYMVKRSVMKMEVRMFITAVFLVVAICIASTQILNTGFEFLDELIVSYLSLSYLKA